MISGLSPLEIIFVLVSLVMAMAVHEAMHGYVAHWLGDDTAYMMGRLTLNPLKHIDLMTSILLPFVLIVSGLPPIFAAKPVPIDGYRIKFEEFGTALVGLAGPLTNFVMAIIAALIFRSIDKHIGTNVGDFILIFIKINIGFFIFNMIPFPPLDGSRLLYAFAPEPLQEIMRAIESAGFMSILIFVLIIFEFISGPIVNIENSLFNLLVPNSLL